MDRVNPKAMNLTNTAVRDLVAPAKGREEVRDNEVNGLMVRVTSNGAKSWCVFRRVKNGQPVRVTIGACDAITSTVARQKAKAIIADLALGNAPVKRPSIQAQIAAKQARQRLTVDALTSAYADLLQTRGQGSHSDVRSIFRLHLIEPHPSIASKPAADLATGEVVDVLRRVKEAGKDRTANKLRSYLRAAYETAIAAHVSHDVPVAFKAFAIHNNPVSSTKADDAANKADKQPHTLFEMRDYWRLIDRAPGKEAAMLRLHLLSGAQRIEQLIRLQRSDIGEESFTIYDSKGKGSARRAHIVPLTTRMRADLQILDDGGTFLFSTKGNEPVEATALRRYAIAHGAKSIPDFKLKRLRSGVETLLASRKVSKEIRGRLQSHGISGVQDKHYDAHEYLDEKRAALELLEAALTSSDAKVIKIKA